MELPAGGVNDSPDSVTRQSVDQSVQTTWFESSANDMSAVESEVKKVWIRLFEQEQLPAGVTSVVISASL